MDAIIDFNLKSYKKEKTDFWIHFSPIMPKLNSSPHYYYLWMTEVFDHFNLNYFSLLALPITEMSEKEKKELKRFRAKLATIHNNLYYLMIHDSIDSESNLIKSIFIDFLSGFENVQPNAEYKIKAICDKCNNDFYQTLDFIENEFSVLIDNFKRWPILCPPAIDFTESYWITKEEFMVEIRKVIINHYKSEMLN